MSPIERCAPGSYSVLEGKVNSPQRRKPKRARQQATQSNILLYSAGCLSKTSFILPIISIVIGRRVGGDRVFVFFLLMPFKTSSKRGESCLENISCRPAWTWRLRTAERYTLIEEWIRPCSAKWLTNISKVSSDVGRGGLFILLQRVK